MQLRQPERRRPALEKAGGASFSPWDRLTGLARSIRNVLIKPAFSGGDAGRLPSSLRAFIARCADRRGQGTKLDRLGYG
jgi:hypothetical protein